MSYGIYFFIISKIIEFIFKYIFIIKRIETVFLFFPVKIVTLWIQNILIDAYNTEKSSEK